MYGLDITVCRSDIWQFGKHCILWGKISQMANEDII